MNVAISFLSRGEPSAKEVCCGSTYHYAANHMRELHELAFARTTILRSVLDWSERTTKEMAMLDVFRFTWFAVRTFFGVGASCLRSTAQCGCSSRFIRRRWAMWIRTPPCGALCRTTRRESSKFEKRRLFRKAARTVAVRTESSLAIIIEIGRGVLRVRVSAQGRHCGHHSPSCLLSDGLRARARISQATLFRALPTHSGQSVYLKPTTVASPRRTVCYAGTRIGVRP
jgi:hypothetical protein